MKYQKTNTHRGSLRFGIMLLMICVIVAILCTVMVKASGRVIRSETERYLGELSNLTSHKVNQTVKYNLEIIKRIGCNVTLMEDDARLQSSYLENMEEGSCFQWVGFVGLDARLKLEGRQEKDVSDIGVVQEAFNGQLGVSESRITVFDGESGILYASPVKQGNMICGAVLGFVKEEVLEEILDANTFDGIGFSYIIAKDGSYILYSDNPYARLKGNNFFGDIREQGTFGEDGAMETMLADMAERTSGSLHLKVEEVEERFMYYRPLDLGGWYLISVMPPQVYAENIKNFTGFALGINVTLGVVFMALIWYIIWSTGKKNREIERMAYLDSVTGGYTPLWFERELKERLKEKQECAFVSLDIRRFKLINDSFGSVEGNRVLKHLHGVIQENLLPGEFTARINDDFFNIVLNSVSHGEIMERLGKIANDVNGYNRGAKELYYLCLDCGIYLIEDYGDDVFVIRDRANTARKKNKETGEIHLCSCVFYSDLERLQMLKEKEMENAMERALEDGEFIIHLQPKVDLENRRIIGAEALVRWESREKGMVYPDEFIPLFERNGFITRVDLYVFETVCKLIRRWMDSGIEPVPVSVNLSRNQLRIPGFLKRYQEIQERYQVPAHLLEIELTETLVFENLEFLKQVIGEIHDIGFHCSMDDFGSGYSSLNVLKEVEVDILKLDRAFFSKEQDKRGEDVIASVINLAKKLNMVTVAEGVETIPQVEFLKQAACDMVQGYVFSRPVPVEEFETLAGMK